MTVINIVLHIAFVVNSRTLYSFIVYNYRALQLIHYFPKMKRSPLNTPHGNRTYGARHTPYNWKLQYENANNRGYQSINNSYQRFSPNNDLQPCGDNFIPLNVSAPVTPHEKHNTNRCSPANGRNSASPGSGWYNQRSNYHATPRVNSNNRYSTYKHSGNQFHGQKRKVKFLMD